MKDNDSLDTEEHDEVGRFREETAAELAPRLRPQEQRDRPIEEVPEGAIADVQEGAGTGFALGITGLVFSLLSLFMLPFLLSLIGIGAGYVALRRGATSLGRWAIGIGIISLIGTLFLAPLIVS